MQMFPFALRERETVGPITWFNPPKHGLQSRTLCGTMCALSIAHSTFAH